MSSQSDYQITVSVDGKPIGVWDTRSGGEVEADLTRRNTGMGPRVYKGRSTPSDVTVSRGYELERDHELARTLEARCGRAAMTVSEQPLDDDGNKWGDPKVWVGILNSVNTGETDSDSTDPRMIELGMLVRESI